MPGSNGAGVNGDYDAGGNAGFGAEYGNGKGYDYPVRDTRTVVVRPYQDTVEEMGIKAQERTAAKTLELDRDKFEFLTKQAALPAGGYPSLATEPGTPASLDAFPVLLVGGLLWFFFKRKR